MGWNDSPLPLLSTLLSSGQQELNGKEKTAALSGRTLDPDFTAHNLYQLPGDREPQARALMPFRKTGINLLKVFEYSLQFAFRYTHPAVFHRKTELHAVVQFLLHTYVYGDSSTVGKFDGIAHQVRQYLLHPQGISDQHIRNVVGYVDIHRQFSGLCAHEKGQNSLLDGIAE